MKLRRRTIIYHTILKVLYLCSLLIFFSFYLFGSRGNQLIVILALSGGISIFLIWYEEMLGNYKLLDEQCPECGALLRRVLVDIEKFHEEDHTWPVQRRKVFQTYYPKCLAVIKTEHSEPIESWI